MIATGRPRACRAPTFDRGRTSLTAVIFFWLAVGGPCLANVYTVQQGDTIEIAVAGLPELRHRTSVQPDGSIAFPLLGSRKVEGMTPGELRLEVQKQLAGKIYRMHNSDGREVLAVIEPDEVSAEIVGYRPVYVTGSVAHPGEEVFRPQMTVRQALALAGGPEEAQTRSGVYQRDYAAIKGDYDVARLDAAKSAIKIARLGAQLQGQSQMPPIDISALKLPKQQVSNSIEDEGKSLASTMADYQRELEFLKLTLLQSSERIAVVDKQRAQEEEGSRDDSAELKRMTDLVSRGQETNPRVTDARRALLLSSTRALQVNVELLELKRQQADAQRSIQRLQDGRRIAWLNELEEATASRNATAVKLRALEDELAASERAHITDSDAELTKFTILVLRQQGSRANQMTVDDDFELMPGDTIEVTVAARGPRADVSPAL